MLCVRTVGGVIMGWWGWSHVGVVIRVVTVIGRVVLVGWRVPHCGRVPQLLGGDHRWMLRWLCLCLWWWWVWVWV